MAFNFENCKNILTREESDKLIAKVVIGDMKMKKCYIAGKISDLPFEEFSSNFRKARLFVFEQLGYDPICPLNTNQVSQETAFQKTWIEYMREDIKALIECDAAYFQSNWKESKGATIEHNLAQALGLEIIYA